ncbi:MAG: response regulator transcription factor [Verrucomicrobia bacterium]|nr:response regulator transcription factor [Verrucomicrobiota bacterium]
MSSKPAKPAAPPPKNILLVDDHPMFREGLATLLNRAPGLQVSGQVEDALQALAAVPRLKPDLVITDISMTGKSGVELIKDLRSLHDKLPVLVVSMHDETLYAERVLKAGGRGYIMKQEGGDKILDAVRQVLAGGIYLSAKMQTRAIERFAGRRAAVPTTPIESLTDREFEVFQLLGRGLATRKIAEQLRISPKTVEVYREKLKTKLHQPDGTSLLRYAVRWVETEDEGS